MSLYIEYIYTNIFAYFHIQQSNAYTCAGILIFCKRDSVMQTHSASYFYKLRLNKQIYIQLQKEKAPPYVILSIAYGKG